MKAGTGAVLQPEVASRNLRPRLRSWCTPSRGDVMAFYLQHLKGCPVHLLGRHVNTDFRSLRTKQCPVSLCSRRAATGTLRWHSPLRLLRLACGHCPGWVFLQLLLSCGIYLHSYFPYFISRLLPFLKIDFAEVYTLGLMECFPYLRNQPSP